MDDATSDDGWMSVREAADFVGVSASTLRRWADAGLVRVNRTPTHHRRFRRDDLHGLNAVAKRSTDVPPPRQASADDPHDAPTRPAGSARGAA